MVLLTVIAAVCHRNAVFVAALSGLVICLLTTKCQSLTSGRTIQDMRSPRIATDRCGRQGVVSNVCDPDRVITFGEGMLRVDWFYIRIVLCYNILQCNYISYQF